MPRVLLIEDDPRLAEMVVRYLGEAGFAVTHAANGKDGVAAAGRDGFDALILDLMLPDIDGLEVCRQVRARADTPILMLTARGDAMDRVVGLELGADDYLPKPFEPRELLARLKAILRRRNGETQREVRFPHPRRPEEDDILVALEEAQRMQTLNLLALHAWLKTEIKVGERFDDWQAGGAHRGLQAACVAQLDVRPQQLLNRVPGTHLARVTAPEDVIEGLERPRHLEIGELRAKPLTERRARCRSVCATHASTHASPPAASVA